MRGILAASCFVALGFGGLGAVRRLATGESCIEPRASRLDRNPSGRQSWHECHYDIRCSLGSADAAPGWCRTDACAKCPIQLADTQASECQSEFACKLSDAMYSLCANECRAATALR